MPNILIIEAVRGIRNSLKERLEYESYTVETAETLQEAVIVAQNFVPHVILCDDYDPLIVQQPFIVLAGNNPIEEAVKAARMGALDVIPNPIDMNRLLSAVRKALKTPAEDHPPEEQPDEPEDSEVRVAKTGPGPGNWRKIPTVSSSDAAAAAKRDNLWAMIGTSAAMTRVKETIARVAASNARVLITGQNGTGKELVARMLHKNSSRSAAPFVEINCAAIPSELIESELFGHEKGSFTSAVKQHKGKFEQAHGGTLFMDEVGDMSLSAQAKVLRALQERRVSRVGSDREIAVDVRVLAATNKNMRDEIKRGAFREDLYYRLGVIIIEVPPLSERTDDIPLLVNHFIDIICDEYGIARKTISDECMDELCKMPWNGNVRELRNVMERLIVLCGDQISLSDIMTHVNHYVI